MILIRRDAGQVKRLCPVLRFGRLFLPIKSLYSENFQLFWQKIFNLSGIRQ